MLGLIRDRTLAAVEGLSDEALDHQHDATSNSIGALLAHMASAERTYQVLSFENRHLSASEELQWGTALTLGTAGRATLRVRSLAAYLEELRAIRDVTLYALAQRDDQWFERALPVAPELNAHWAWFHVAEDELGHAGQIRWLKARLP
jgi:uncharacterized damage-inducible protein DinB